MLKKVIGLVCFAGFSFALLPASARADEHTYECYRYVNGHPTGGWINVKASSKEEAEAKAYLKFKELGGQVDYAVCHA